MSHIPGKCVTSQVNRSRHRWMSVNESCHLVWMSHVTWCEWVMSLGVNESCHLVWMSLVTWCEWVSSLVNESRHRWMSHITVQRHRGMSHVTGISAPICRKMLSSLGFRYILHGIFQGLDMSYVAHIHPQHTYTHTHLHSTGISTGHTHARWLGTHT